MANKFNNSSITIGFQFSQVDPMTTNAANSVRLSKIYYLKQSKRSQSSSKKPQIHLSAAHISSMIQSQKKQIVNRQMMEFTNRLTQNNRFSVFCLTERPKTQEIAPNRKIQLFRSEVNSSNCLRKKVKDESNNFYKWCGFSNKEAQKICEQLELSKSKRRNYKMRKIQFRSFIKEQQNKAKPILSPEIKEIKYEKEQLNKWGLSLPIHHNLEHSPKRNGQLQQSLNVVGSRYKLKNQKRSTQ